MGNSLEVLWRVLAGMLWEIRVLLGGAPSALRKIGGALGSAPEGALAAEGALPVHAPQ